MVHPAPCLGQVMGKPENERFSPTGADRTSCPANGFVPGMRVTALVTDGVEPNAVRMSRDSGDYYEPGTTIHHLTNMSLDAEGHDPGLYFGHRCQTRPYGPDVRIRIRVGQSRHRHRNG